MKPNVPKLSRLQGIMQAHCKMPRCRKGTGIHTISDRGGTMDGKEQHSSQPSIPSPQVSLWERSPHLLRMFNGPKPTTHHPRIRGIARRHRVGQLCHGHGLLEATSHTKCLLTQQQIILQATQWISGLITQLLQATHTQWIYQCVLVHNRTTGVLISSHKEEFLKEIDHQLSLGLEGLEEEDRFLLECNFDTLTTTNGEQQEYWLLAIQAAREASRIHTETTVVQQQRIMDTTQRWA